MALQYLRRNLERVAARREPERRSPMAVKVDDLKRELEELIAALDRRVPRVQQAGEAEIARDAAALRARAVTRLAELADEPLVPSAERADTSA